MNHPYERLGIITSVVILVAVLAVGMVMMNPCDFIICKGSGSGGSGGSHAGELSSGLNVDKYIPWVPKPIHSDYYSSCPDMASDPEGYDACHKKQEVQECKKTSKNYEEFFDCVNCPDPVKCEMKWNWMDNQK